ncbi:Uncharacterized protein Adt_28240 [Abeliophyllum distichum]|uniref:UBN2 domain-containing protein n=1 Tax=Abeliophyllum distichum TaxID=126358 RepID=A0ABD1RVZ3_9LAMI
MKQDEPIVDMITRFTDIINGLKGFDRKFTNGELVSKMLRSLSEDWNSLKMLTENTKDVNTHPLKELYGTLMTYELNNIETKEKTRKSKEEIDNMCFMAIEDEVFGIPRKLILIYLATRMPMGRLHNSS